MLTKEQIAEIHRLTDLASKGPWKAKPDPEDAKTNSDWIVERPPGYPRDLEACVASLVSKPADALFVAASREAIPALLAERKELIGLLRDLEWSQKTTKLKNGGTIYTATTCPCCGGEKPDHAPGCRLAAFLR